MDYSTEYSDAVGMALINLKEGDIFVIENNVKEINRTKFVQCVKDYQDKHFGNDEGWQVEFNSLFSKIRKIYFTRRG